MIKIQDQFHGCHSTSPAVNMFMYISKYKCTSIAHIITQSQANIFHQSTNNWCVISWVCDSLIPFWLSIPWWNISGEYLTYSPYGSPMIWLKACWTRELLQKSRYGFQLHQNRWYLSSLTLRRWCFGSIYICRVVL